MSDIINWLLAPSLAPHWITTPAITVLGWQIGKWTAFVSISLIRHIRALQSTSKEGK